MIQPHTIIACSATNQLIVCRWWITQISNLWFQQFFGNLVPQCISVCRAAVLPPPKLRTSSTSWPSIQPRLVPSFAVDGLAAHYYCRLCQPQAYSLPMTDNAQKLNPSSLSYCRFPSVHFLLRVLHHVFLINKLTIVSLMKNRPLGYFEKNCIFLNKNVIM